MAKYSIILPVRNGGEYIKLCVNSILGQQLKDFNLIILENCSTDGTREWIDSLDDGRVMMVPATEPLNMEENWGRIKDIPRNEFMTMLGADDILYPNYLAVMDSLIKKHPTASLYQTHFRFIDPVGKELRDCEQMKEVESAAEFLESIYFNKTSIMGTGFMMRSADYDAIGGVPMYPNLLFADFELWLELTRLGYKATSPEFAFSYRVHPLSTTSSSNFEKYAQGFERLMKYFKRLKEVDPAMRAFIDDNSIAFINNSCKGSAHKLLRTPVKYRGGMSVSDVLDQYKFYAKQLVPGKTYRPTDTFSIWLAKAIDSNSVSRILYLLFKKFYTKPIYQ